MENSNTQGGYALTVRTLFTIVWFASISPAVLLVAPALVGGMVTELGFSPQQAGGVLSVELGGMALATFPALYWIPRMDWRRAVTIAVVIMVVGNVASALATTVGMLSLTRFVTALAGGSVMIISMTIIGSMKNQGRVFGFWVTGQLLFGAVGLALLPHILPLWGLKAFYAAMAAMLLAMMTLIRHLPRSRVVHNNSPAAKLGWRIKILATFGLVSVLLFYIALSGVWAYMERMATNSGLEPKSIGYSLSVASLVGIVGAVSSSVLGERWGRFIPIVVGYVLLLFSISLLATITGLNEYLIAACLFKYGWTFVLPFLLASIAKIEMSGRLIALTNVMIGGGLALGPAIAARVLSSGTNYDHIINLGIVAGLISMFLILPVTRINGDEH